MISTKSHCWKHKLKKESKITIGRFSILEEKSNNINIYKHVIKENPNTINIYEHVIKEHEVLIIHVKHWRVTSEYSKKVYISF